jgi:hypothetical protein
VNRRSFVAAMGASFIGTCASAETASDSGLQSAARDAWLFVAPLIEVAARRARPAPGSGRPALLNVFEHSRSPANPASRSVTTPNNDTLYSNAFVDVTSGPVLLDVPDGGSRYLSVQVMDMYTNNNFILSPRTPGGAAGTWRLVPPGAKPENDHDLRLATPHAWLIARILVNGLDDLPAVHAVQDRLALHGPVSPAPISKATLGAPWPAYFAAAEELLRSDPPPFRLGLDAFTRMHDAGERGDFSRTGYSVEAAAAIDAGVADAIATVRSAGRRRSFVDGWTYPRSNLGEYGDDFVFRAMVAVIGLGALKPSEAMYMRSAGDGHGLFEGDDLYRLSLLEPIPVDAFWSLTMYEALPDGHIFLTANTLNRYAIGDRTEGLVRGADGALEIWIGRADPGGTRTANWLPAPKQGPFAVTLRAYLPRRELADGSYRIPPIVPT